MSWRDTPVNKEVLHIVEQLLYREARLLDERKFLEWLDMLTDDIRYWMPLMSRRYPISSKAIAILDESRYVEDEYSADGELAILDDTKETLTRRVARLHSGMAWAEDPPSHTCHMISNIEVRNGDSDSELLVNSNFIMYRTRAETEQDFYVGRREDILRHVDGEWKIAYRKIILPQSVLSAKNVSNFF